MATKQKSSKASAELRRALFKYKGVLLGVMVFSATANLLMLVGPLFMLQVYDRVLSSRSGATLLALLLIVLFLYTIMAMLDFARSRVLTRVGAGFQHHLDPRIIDLELHRILMSVHMEVRQAPIRDVAAIQRALSSSGVQAVFDLPWTPLFVMLLFIFHPWLGWFCLVSIVLLLGLALANQRSSCSAQSSANKVSLQADALASSLGSAVEAAKGLGMVRALSGRWLRYRAVSLSASVEAIDTGSGYLAATRAVRLMLQSAILALGAALVLRNELTPGAMIASSILLGRALNPVELIIGAWPQLEAARHAYNSLSRQLDAIQPNRPRFKLPSPTAHVEVRGLSIVPPNELTPCLRGVSFSAKGGDAIAVVGPSASGKSALARALTGIWASTSGEIRLSGALIQHYDPDVLGQRLGYLPQDVSLLEGEVGENISRFQPNATDERVVEAARRAAVHEMIMKLPDGYNTKLHEGACWLSGGQRQRIGLARALYGDPILLVLDEPNSNLDEEGNCALNHAIRQARLDGRIVVVMSHRPSVLSECNLVLVLHNGVMRDFGLKNEVLANVTRRNPGTAVTRIGQLEAGGRI